MLASRALCILAAAALPSCVIYDGALIDEATAGIGSGSATFAGGSGGMELVTGGSGGDGMPSIGGTMGEAGGAGNAGGSTGGDGSGGETQEETCVGICVDNMNHAASGFGWKNPEGGANLGLNWMTYDDGSAGAEWVSPESPTKFMTARADHPNPDGTNEKELYVEATGFEDWGIGVFVNLAAAGPESVNLAAPTAYTGVRFWVKGDPAGHPSLNVAVEDGGSHGGTVHPKTVAPVFLDAEWQVVELSFADDFDAPIDASAIYAIHFTVDPDDSTGHSAIFSIDDLSFYE